MSTEATIVLYIFIFAISTFFMYLSQRYVKFNQIIIKQRFNIVWFIAAFVPLWFVSCFTNIGADYGNYTDIIKNAVQVRSDYGIVEWLFYTICKILYDVFRNTDIVIFIIKSTTLLLFFCGLYMIRRMVPLWMSILAFCGLRFLEFYLIQMQFSAAVFFIAVIFLLRGKILKSFLCYIISAFIHSSAFVFLPIFILFFLLNGYNKLLSKAKVFSILICCVTISIAWLPIALFAVGFIPFFQHYAAYSLIEGYSGSGIAIYIYYLPILYFCTYAYKNYKFLFRYVNIIIFLSAFCFLFGSLGYKIEVIGRLRSYSIVIQMMLVPIYLYARHCYPVKSFLDIKSENVIWVLFLLFQSTIFFLEKISSETSFVSAWHFYNPFIFS